MNDDVFVLVDGEQLKSRLCDIHDCADCPFNSHEDYNCHKTREEFIREVSASTMFTFDIATQVKSELLSSMKDLAKETRDMIYDKFNEIIQEEHKKIDNEIVKATIFIVGKSGSKYPYGTYYYRTIKEQIRVIDIARKVAKEYGCKYEIKPITRKEMGE